MRIWLTFANYNNFMLLILAELVTAENHKNSNLKNSKLELDKILFAEFYANVISLFPGHQYFSVLTLTSNIVISGNRDMKTN